MSPLLTRAAFARGGHSCSTKQPGACGAIQAADYGLDAATLEQLLNDFWLARGVHSAADRRELLQIALSTGSAHSSASGNIVRLVKSTPAVSVSPNACDGDSPEIAQAVAAERPSCSTGAHLPGQEAAALPGVQTVWELRMQEYSAVQAHAAQSVQEMSVRIAQLAALIGAHARAHDTSDSDAAADTGASACSRVSIASMLVREPRLATADLNAMAARLLQLRLAGHSNLAHLLESQPALLLGAATDARALAGEQTPQAHNGAAAERTADWDRHFAALQGYACTHGDAHCGFRESDPRELARWCKQQRAAHRKDALSAAQRERLLNAGFEFDSEAAEWWRGYHELQHFKRQHGVAESGPFTAERDIYLTNWCSVQRIARRSGVLSADRQALLDELGFVWTGADALS